MHDVRISVWQIGTAMRPEWKLVENQTPNVPSKTMIFRKIEPVLSHFWAIEENFARCLNPTTGDRIVWHTDIYDHRIVAFFLILTVQEYRGGTLQIRYRGSEEILHEVRNTGPGDALLMRVVNKLFYRVLPVERNVPRTAKAGWFRWEKRNDNFDDALRKAPQVSSAKQVTLGTELSALDITQH
jgi:hypothetical protein